MSWIHFPLVNGDDMQLYAALEELWFAEQERHKGLGEPFWPKPNTPYESGESFTLTNAGSTYTLTDSGKHWTLGTPPAGCGYSGTRWFEYNIECPPQSSDNIIPFYDVIFDHAEPKRVVRAQITAENGDDTLPLTFTPSIASLIAQGVIDDVSDLESRTYYIIKRGGLWWSDRWPNFPNPNTRWKGNVSAFVHRLTIDPPATVPLAGKTLRRDEMDDVTIIASGAGYIIIAHESEAPSGDVEVYNGETLLYSGTITAAANGIYQQTDFWRGKNTWTPPQAVALPIDLYDGRDLLVADAGGEIHRVSITGNDTNVLLFDDIEWVPVGEYAIVAAGDFHVLGHENMQVGWWYGGMVEGYWSHPPDDSGWPGHLRTIAKPVSITRIEDADNETACADPGSNFTVFPFDRDVWTSLTNVCGGWQDAEKCYSPNLPKTFRFLQNDVLGISPAFIEKGNYVASTAIPLLVPGRLLYDGDVNKFDSTTTRVATTGDPSLYHIKLGNFTDLPYSPISAYYCVVDAKGDNVYHGIATLEEGEDVLIAGLELNDADSFAVSNLAVKWSYGFTRYVPLRFRYWPTHEKTIFIPDVLTIGDPPEEVMFYPPEVADYCCDEDDPPPEECCRSCDGVGHWVTHGGSSTYLVRDGYGFVTEGAQAFAEGDVARFVGDNFADPALGGLWVKSGDAAPDDPHWDRFYRGLHRPDLQAAHESQKVGKATAGDAKSLTDTEQDWYIDWYGDGEMRAESGTATGGSATTLIDTAKVFVDTGDGNEAACFWNLDRHITGDGNVGYKDFVLEVVRTVEGVPTTHKAIITGVNPTTGTLTFAGGFTSGITVTAGDVYRIVEPSELNRWKNRKVRLTYADGSTATATITHNDATTIFFAAELDEPIVEGTRYQIIEPRYGDVMIYTDGEWVVPEGSDPRGQPWREDSRLNLPHKLKLYGSMMAGDIVHRELLNELHRTIDRLRWIRREVGWDSRSADFPIEEFPDVANQIAISVSDPSDASICEEAWEGYLDAYEAKWAANDYSLTTVNDAPLFSMSGSLKGVGSGISASQRISCAVVNTPHSAFTREVEVFSYSHIDSVDADDGMTLSYGSPDEDGNRVVGHLDKSFNAQGTPMLFRQWSNWVSFTGTDDDYKSGYVGSPVMYIPPVGMPTPYESHVESTEFCTTHAPSGNELGGEDRAYGERFEGFRVVRSYAIVKYDVPGGFTKVTP